MNGSIDSWCRHDTAWAKTYGAIHVSSDFDKYDVEVLHFQFLKYRKLTEEKKASIRHGSYRDQIWAGNADGNGESLFAEKGR